MDANPTATHTADDAVVAEALTKRFGSQTVVDRVSFTIPSGVVAGLIGPNGAGKTTILGMLLGLVRPTSGTAQVLGADVSSRGEYLGRVGSLIESPAFHPGVSAVDNLRALAVLDGRPSDTIGAQIDELIDLVGLSGRGGDRYGSYSLGMKQRLGIAAALIGDPDLVVLDEPTNGLDPMGMQDVRRMIARIAAGGRTVIVSSHLLAELEAVCDWLVVVDRGGLVHCGPLTTLGGASDALVVAAGREHTDGLECVIRTLGLQPELHDPDTGAWRLLVDESHDMRATATAINLAAHRAGIVVGELRHQRANLESRYLDLVSLGGRS
jgi:ABC-2 type transport system ATP-binding protein